MYITSVARISGWALDFILWELPYAAGLQMMHAEARYQGEEVEFVTPRAEVPDGGMQKAFAQLRAEPRGKV